MKNRLESRNGSWVTRQERTATVFAFMRNAALPLVFVHWLVITAIGAGYDLPPDFYRMPVSIWFSMPGYTNQTFAFTNQTPAGSGVYLAKSNALYLVTAKHVILDVASTNLPLRGTNAMLYTPTTASRSPDRFCTFNVDLDCLNKGGFVKPHPSRDLLVIQLAKGTFNHGVSSSNPPNCLVWFNIDEQVQTAEKILVGDDTLMFGYPVELLKGLSREVDFDLPLVRRGTISQKNPKTGKFILDSSSFGGNSGGPLIVILGNRKSPWMINEPITYKIAGIITQFVPAATRVFADAGVTNSVLAYSGYSVAEPIDAAIELIREFKN